MSGSAAREGRTAGLRRLAGPDDGRMYGMSDTGYQRTLRRLTDAENEANVGPFKIETRIPPTTRPPLTNGGFSDSAEGADD